MTAAQRAGAIADQLRTALARLGRWQDGALDPARLVDMGPFGMRTLAPEEWLQFVLVPRLDDVAHDEAALPGDSATAAWATRQFDGDPDGEAIVAVLRELDALVVGHALVVAVVGTYPDLEVIETAPFELELARLGTTTAPAAAVEAALDAGAAPDTRVASSLTALMIATLLGHREAAAVLRARGANPELRDELGRTAERFAVFPAIGAAIRLCRGVAAVEAAYVSQLHAPATHQFTTPILGLQVSAALPTDAFAAWPADLAVIVFVLGDDPTSRLIRLAPPVYLRLSRERMVVGRRYRVIEPRGPLALGRTVRYDGLDDRDNHWGVYRFTAEDGAALELAGDPSSASGPLADVARFLVEV